MVKVIERDGTDNRMAWRRCGNGAQASHRSNVSEQAAFDATDTLDYLCRMSGGHARNLLILLRSACDWLDDLPITRRFTEEAVREMRNDLSAR
jgi:hypothetical protein